MRSNAQRAQHIQARARRISNANNNNTTTTTSAITSTLQTYRMKQAQQQEDAYFERQFALLAMAQAAEFAAAAALARSAVIEQVTQREDNILEDVGDALVEVVQVGECSFDFKIELIDSAEITEPVEVESIEIDLAASSSIASSEDGECFLSESTPPSSVVDSDDEAQVSAVKTVDPAVEGVEDQVDEPGSSSGDENAEDDAASDCGSIIIHDDESDIVEAASTPRSAFFYAPGEDSDDDSDGEVENEHDSENEDASLVPADEVEDCPVEQEDVDDDDDEEDDSASESGSIVDHGGESHQQAEAAPAFSSAFWGAPSDSEDDSDEDEEEDDEESEEAAAARAEAEAEALASFGGRHFFSTTAAPTQTLTAHSAQPELDSKNESEGEHEVHSGRKRVHFPSEDDEVQPLERVHWFCKAQESTEEWIDEQRCGCEEKWHSERLQEINAIKRHQEAAATEYEQERHDEVALKVAQQALGAYDERESLDALVEEAEANMARNVLALESEEDKSPKILAIKKRILTRIAADKKEKADALAIKLAPRSATFTTSTVTHNAQQLGLGRAPMRVMSGRIPPAPRTRAFSKPKVELAAFGRTAPPRRLSPPGGSLALGGVGEEEEEE